MCIRKWVRTCSTVNPFIRHKTEPFCRYNPERNKRRNIPRLLLFAASTTEPGLIHDTAVCCAAARCDISQLTCVNQFDHLQSLRSAAMALSLAGLEQQPSYQYNPRITPISVSTTPYRVNTCKFAPTSSTTSAAATRLLATGSHHGAVNTVAVHQLDTDVDVMDDDSAAAAEQQREVGKEKLSPSLASVDVKGDVNALCWAPAVNNSRLLVAATSAGDIHFLSHSRKPNASPTLTLTHTHQASDLSINTLDIVSSTTAAPLLATAGDDTTLRLYDLATLAIAQSMPNASTGLTTRIKAAGHLLYLAGLHGRIRLLDTRLSSPTPILTLHASSSSSSPSPTLTALAVHPARPDTLIAGSEMGDVSVFDTRYGSAPINSFRCAETAVNDLTFLPFDASTVVAAVEDGGLFAFDFNRERKDSTHVDYRGEVSSLLLFRGGAGMRCVDVDRSSHTLVSSSDSQQLVHFQYLLS